MQVYFYFPSLLLQVWVFCGILVVAVEQIYARRTNDPFILGVAALKNALKSQESLRISVAGWLLRNDKQNICCEGNELGDEFLENYELPELEEELFETLVSESGEITLVFQSKISLTARQTVNGKPASFIIVRYVRALYDDFGNIYRYVTLGYNF